MTELRKALVIDDNRERGRSTVRWLRIGFGLESDLVESFEDAVGLLRGQRYVVVITDWDFPVCRKQPPKSGVGHRIAEICSDLPVPFVILSGHSRPSVPPNWQWATAGTDGALDVMRDVVEKALRGAV
jgi:CheY-like chemotaxis protein